MGESLPLWSTACRGVVWSGEGRNQQQEARLVVPHRRCGKAVALPKSFVVGEASPCRPSACGIEKSMPARARP